MVQIAVNLEITGDSSVQEVPDRPRRAHLHTDQGVRRTGTAPVVRTELDPRAEAGDPFDGLCQLRRLSFR
jgi:hypothetical protein